jgi:hypothetical protein
MQTFAEFTEFRQRNTRFRNTYGAAAYGPLEDWLEAQLVDVSGPIIDDEP